MDLLLHHLFFWPVAAIFCITIGDVSQPELQNNSARVKYQISVTAHYFVFKLSYRDFLSLRLT